MNDSVDLARDVTKPPEGYFDLGKMLKELIGKNVTVKVLFGPELDTACLPGEVA